MLWFWSALLAAIFWGISYSVGEYTLKNGMSASGQMALFGILLTPIYTALAYYNGSLQTSFNAIRTNPKVLYCFIIIAFCYGFANFLSYFAIQQKNATVASLVEISYPLFVTLFAYIIFRDMQLTRGVLIGGALILSGICVMYGVK